MEHDPGTVRSASYVVRAGPATTAVGARRARRPRRCTARRSPISPTATRTQASRASQSGNVSHTLGTQARGGHDVTVVSLRVAVPEDANCLTLGASFFSEDYGDGTTDDPAYFDSFLAELDPGARGRRARAIPRSIAAPANFARVQMPDGLKPVSAQVHSGSFSTQNAFGTDVRRDDAVAHVQGPGHAGRARPPALDLRPRRRRLRLDGAGRRPAADPPAAGDVLGPGPRPVLDRRGPRGPGGHDRRHAAGCGGDGVERRGDRDGARLRRP